MRMLLAVVAIATLAGCTTAGPNAIQVAVTDAGFQPNTTTIQAGQTAVLWMTRKTDHTCATEAIVTETGRRYDLPLNQPVRIDLTNVGPGTVHYSCGMGMLHGTVTIL
jgi:plastocyanin domain-containing protein